MYMIWGSINCRILITDGHPHSCPIRMDTAEVVQLVIKLGRVIILCNRYEYEEISINIIRE